MNSTESLHVCGRLTFILRDQYGRVKELRRVRNLIVNTGLGHITARLVGTSQGVMSHMALGSSSLAVAAGNTTLGSQLGSREVLESVVRQGLSSESVVYVATFDPGEATGAITEAGIFNASSAGVMLCRTVFAVINKSVSDTLQVTWTVTFSG